ncbi:transporter substrate-binding domain-containing protein [Ideonella sp. DXS22W]|uniref:Transporter substrate-binding domain-containing protein n=1 Tax=Pseudaquabacterium inlustre TaxID=2984192 RepID=A0ABU9CLN8_9BURK
MPVRALPPRPTATARPAAALLAAACLAVAASAQAGGSAGTREGDTALPGLAPLAGPDPQAPLYARLPEAVRLAGALRFVGDSHPPYRIVDDHRRISAGIDPDLARALERQLGLPIRHHVVNSLSATLAGLESGRYDVAMGPAVATRERQQRFDGVSWMTNRPAFVYPQDRTPRYTTPEHLCGRKIAYVAGSITERVVNRLSERCQRQGLPAAQHVPLVDTNMTLVATQAGRADLAGMTLTAASHAVHVNPQRFGLYSDASGALGRDLLSLFVTKRSGLGPVLTEAMNRLMAEGQYARVMDHWGVAAVSVPQARFNQAQ